MRGYIRFRRVHLPVACMDLTSYHTIYKENHFGHARFAH